MMDHLTDEVGSWKREKILGSGGFGYVVLWRNKETNETIALKECRWGNDPTMTPKHRSRWKQEVDIMAQLDHPNVVKAIPVPEELDVPPTELPLLAMEFCSSGDLRKLLSKPENSCGLKEKHVRLIMRHVSSALNYLHSKGIIHRDLKPENIVIQNQNGNAVYKLIDLGYAKVLDQGSLCSSFVGTFQYLAPELFMSQKYTCTVDYWSLGLVTHEIITGTRPFLPDKSPAEWIPIIRKKSPDQIRAYLDEDKNIMFSNQISPFHNISNVFKKDVEKWLQLMLHCDPEKRGRSEKSSYLTILENILTKKVLLVFCVETLKLHSLTVADKLTLTDLSELIIEETQIPSTQQLILLPDGQCPDTNKGVEQLVRDLEKEEFIVYLYDAQNLSSCTPPSSATFLSASVEQMMKNPHSKMDYAEQREVWREGVHLCQQEFIRVTRVLHSFKAIVKYFMSNVSIIHKSLSHVTEEVKKLMAKCSFMKHCLQDDIAFYEKQRHTISRFFPQMLEEWKDTLKNLKKVDIFRQKVLNVEVNTSKIISQAIELQKSPFITTRITTPIEEVYKKILESYSEIKKRESDKRKIAHDNTDYVRLVCMCIQRCHSLIQETLQLISQTKELDQALKMCERQVLEFPFETTEWEAQVENWQSQRQQQIWNLIRVLSQPRENQNEGPCQSAKGFQSLAQNIVTDDPKVSISSQGSKSLHLSSRPSFSSVLEQASRENRRVKEENENLVESFQAMMDILKSYKEP